MGKRSTGRKLAFQILFQIEVRNRPIDEIIEDFDLETNFQEDTKLWAIELAKPAWADHENTDKLIIQYAIDWTFDRINTVDKSILRLAFYELRHTKTHPNIILDEAIELSKKYSTDESPKFVNGILGKYVEECLQES